MSYRPHSDAEVLAVLKEGPRFTRTGMAEKVITARKEIQRIRAALDAAPEPDQVLGNHRYYERWYSLTLKQALEGE